MGKKFVIIFLSLLITISAGCGFYGTYLHFSKKNEKPKIDYKASYIYYLDDVEIEAIPINEVGKSTYQYSRYTCTNNVVGSWDNSTWKFTPNLTANTTCKLYFVTSELDMSFKIENGKIENVTPTNDEIYLALAKAGKNADFIQAITPNEGHVFKSAACTNNEVTSWDSIKNELTIKSVQASSLCSVIFEPTSYDLEIKVQNGIGATTLSIKHGSDANAVITPSKGYGNPTVECTNEQIGTWNNNKFNATKIIKDSSCTIEFNLLTYTVKVNVTGGKTTGSPATINYNEDGSFTITADEGYTIEDAELTGSTCTNGSISSTSGKLVLTVTGVTSNATCNVNLKTESDPIDNE